VTAKPTLPEGFRYLRASDAKLAFSTGVPLVDRTTVADYVRVSREPDSLVVVKVVEDRPVALAQLRISPGIVVIELLARDQAQPRGAGAQLVTVVEKYVAPIVGAHELRLEAMNEALADYYVLLGFNRYGDPYVDPEWGPLIPMRKLLS
jgi:hypothetical protein